MKFVFKARDGLWFWMRTSGTVMSDQCRVRFKVAHQFGGRVPPPDQTRSLIVDGFEVRDEGGRACARVLVEEVGYFGLDDSLSMFKKAAAPVRDAEAALWEGHGQSSLYVM